MQPIRYHHPPATVSTWLPRERKELAALVKIGLTQFGSHQIEPGFLLGRPEHPFHYHLLVARGRLCYRVVEDGQERSGSLVAGDLWQCPIGVPYELRSDEAGSACWWSLDPAFPVLAASRATVVPHRSLQERIGPLFAWLAHDLGMHDASATSSLRQISGLLATALRRVCSEQHRAADVTARRCLQPLWQTVVERPALPWTLDELADRCGLSRFQLIRRMRDTYQCTPMEMVGRLRLEIAEDQLLNGDDPLEQIAASVGYSSAFALSKAFKRRYGTSPGAFRRRR